MRWESAEALFDEDTSPTAVLDRAELERLLYAENRVHTPRAQRNNELRSRYVVGETCEALAEEFGLRLRTVQNIVAHR